MNQKKRPSDKEAVAVRGPQFFQVHLWWSSLLVREMCCKSPRNSSSDLRNRSCIGVCRQAGRTNRAQPKKAPAVRPLSQCRKVRLLTDVFACPYHAGDVGKHVQIPASENHFRRFGFPFSGLGKRLSPKPPAAPSTGPGQTCSEPLPEAVRAQHNIESPKAPNDVYLDILC